MNRPLVQTVQTACIDIFECPSFISVIYYIFKTALHPSIHH